VCVCVCVCVCVPRGIKLVSAGSSYYPACCSMSRPAAGGLMQGSVSGPAAGALMQGSVSGPAAGALMQGCSAKAHGDPWCRAKASSQRATQAQP